MFIARIVPHINKKWSMKNKLCKEAKWLHLNTTERNHIKSQQAKM